jgi:Spy/CpxP family protein refolding chaperone
MKRALLALVVGAVLSGLAAAYAASAERSPSKRPPSGHASAR